MSDHIPTDDRTAARAHYERSRRDFLAVCARMSVAVPPAVMLLASAPDALASTGGRPANTPPFSTPPVNTPPNRR